MYLKDADDHDSAMHFSQESCWNYMSKHFPKIHGSNLMDSKENPSEAEKERERGEGGRRNKNKKNATIQELNTPIHMLRPKGETNFLRAIFRNWKNRASPQWIK